MHNLTPLTALGEEKPVEEQVGALTLRECPDWAFASVAARNGKAEATIKGLEKAIGKPVPQVGEAVFGKQLGAFWTGPDQWMVEEPSESHELLAESLIKALKESASITEQSDAWVRFDLAGKGAKRAFEVLCNLNIDAMADGQASRTSIHHIGCFVICRQHDEHYSIMGLRSSARSLHHAIMLALGVVA